MADTKPISLVGLCPTCGTNLDFGGSDDCEVCAAEPAMVTIVEADDRDIIVVIISDGQEVSDQSVLDYLTAMFPTRRALPVRPFLSGEVSYVEWTDHGLVVILVPSIGG